MSVQNVALLRMAGRLVDVSGRSGQAHFEDQIRGAWNSVLGDIPQRLASDAALSERFAGQLAAAAGKPQHATLLFAMIDDGGKDTIVGEFFQNAEIEQLARLGQSNPDVLRLFGRVSGAEGDPIDETGARAPLVEFGLASVPVPPGEPAAGSAVVTATHVFPGAWEGPDSPGILRDLVRIHEAITRHGARKPLERPGQPQIDLWLALNPGGSVRAAAAPAKQPPLEASAVEIKVPEGKIEPKPAAVKPEAKAPEPKVESKPASPPVRQAAEPPKPAKPAPPVLQPRHSAPVEVAPEGGTNRTLLYGGIGAVAAGLAIGAYFLFGTGSSATPAASQPAPAPQQQQEVIASPPAPSPFAPAPAPVSSAARSERAKDTPVPPAAESATAPAVEAAAAPAARPEPAAEATAPAPAPDNSARRAAALDALGLDRRPAPEDKKRDALKALTGE